MAVYFLNDTATTEIYTLSLHDALPIYARLAAGSAQVRGRRGAGREPPGRRGRGLQDRDEGVRLFATRSEEHTSELQSRQYFVCRLLLETKQLPLPCHVFISHHISRLLS